MSRSPKWIAAVAALVMVGLVVVVWWLKGVAVLEVVNPLPRAIVVRVDEGAPTTIAAESAHGVEVGRSGPHVIRVVDEKGVPVETVMASLRGNARVNVYNVLGLGAVYLERIAYSKYSSPEPTLKVFCGVKVFDVDDIDYRWVDAPQTISVSENSGSVFKNHLGLAPGGMRKCAGYAAQNDLGLDAIAYAEASESAAVEKAYSLANEGQHAQATAMMRDAIKAAEPGDLQLQRSLQNLFIMTGREAKIREAYRARAIADTATASDLYLEARIAPTAEELAHFDAGLVRFPQSAWLHWGRAQALLAEGRDAEALKALEVVRRNPESVSLAWVGRGQAWALSRLGRTQDAFGVLTASIDPSNEGLVDVTLALLFRAVATAAHSREPMKFPEAAEAWLAAYDAVDKGQTPSPLMHEGKKELTVATAARTLAVEALIDPSKALADVKKAPDRALQWMQAVPRTLLLTEAWRVGDVEAAARLSNAVDLGTPPLDAVRAFLIDGTEGELSAICDDTMWSALWFARARWAAESTVATAAMKKAKFLDPPGGYASMAMSHWGAPSPTVRPADAWVWRTQ